MKLSYSKSFLSDGTKVKITKELMCKIKEWRKEGYEISDFYIDFLKINDDIEINNNRNYYIHNLSLEYQLENNYFQSIVSEENRSGIENLIIKNENRSNFTSIINGCTAKQKRRFIKYYILNYSLIEIAKQENCSPSAVFYSIKTVVKKVNIL